MSHRDSEDKRNRTASGYAGAGDASGFGFGGYDYRTPVHIDSGFDSRVSKENEEALQEDYKELKREAKTEYKHIRAQLAERYEARLSEAKQQYLEDAVASREKLMANRQLAREEYEAALRNAKTEYDFTVEIAKDHYKTLRKETTRIMEHPEQHDPHHEPAGPDETGATRVITRLDEEIRRISRKKAAEQAWRENPGPRIAEN